MITLRELLKLNETVTLLELYVRNPDGSLIRRCIIGEPYVLTMHQENDRSIGKLEYIDKSINIHGRPDRSGQSRITYGMDWSAIPKSYLDAEVTSISRLRERYNVTSGSELDATIVPVQLEMDLGGASCGR